MPAEPPAPAPGPVAGSARQATRGPGRRAVLRAGGLGLLAGALPGCGVRWSDVRLDDVATPSPPRLSADDLARFAAVVEVRALLDLATAVSDPAGAAPAAAVAERHRVHLDRLGPLPGPVPSPSATPSGWPTGSPPPSGPVDLAALGAAELAASGRLLAPVTGTAVGGGTARLVAVVATSCLATAAGLGTAVPAAVPPPAPDDVDPGAGGAGGAGGADGAATEVTALVETHRAAGYGYGVLAVRLAGAERAAARAAIAGHAELAGSLVVLAEAAGVSVPPAQPAYVVPRPADAAAAADLALALELDVAAAAGALLAATTGAWRALAVDQLTGATLAGLPWGALPAFPGAPDLS